MCKNGCTKVAWNVQKMDVQNMQYVRPATIQFQWSAE